MSIAYIADVTSPCVQGRFALLMNLETLDEAVAGECSKSRVKYFLCFPAWFAGC
jgi:hypothetical protein